MVDVLWISEKLECVVGCREGVQNLSSTGIYRRAIGWMRKEARLRVHSPLDASPNTA